MFYSYFVWVDMVRGYYKQAYNVSLATVCCIDVW